MPTDLTYVHASTQDPVSGTQVATAINEDGTGYALQAMVAFASKSTFASGSVLSISSASSPASGIMGVSGFAGTGGSNLLYLGNSTNTHAWCSCTSGSAVMTGQMAYYDSGFNFLCFGPLMTFTSNATLRVSSATGNYIAQEANYGDLSDNRSATYGLFFVQSVSAGTWIVNLRPL